MVLCFGDRFIRALSNADVFEMTNVVQMTDVIQKTNGMPGMIETDYRRNTKCTQ
ncbi:MAG: hypothetical protein H6Q62_235 [Firmicutes bacterium]|nr:hypothetical protein [Bacillota bacterium]